MAFFQLLALTVANQTLQALAAYAHNAAPHATTAEDAAWLAVLEQWAVNLNMMVAWGLVAINQEFTAAALQATQQIANETTIANNLPSLPPIS